MRKPLYWAAAALLCGATMVGFASCGDDDENENQGGGTSTTISNPVKDTDFTVSVSGNVVTVSTNLTYGTMYVLYQGAQRSLADGKVDINIPVAGTYTMSFNFYENGTVYSSDDFSVTIESSDLSFLDEGVYKILSGGQEVYAAAAKSADDNGVFTRSWRLDGFVNSDGYAYSKVFNGPGTFCLESDNACYNGGVVKGGQWRDLGDYEDATISFDVVNQKVKVSYKSGAKLQESAAPNAVNKIEDLTGDFYGTFTMTDIEGAETFLSAIDSWAKSTTSVNGLEIVMDGDNVRIPFLKQALAWPLSLKKDLTDVKIFASQSAEEKEDGIMILTAVSNNTDQVVNGSDTTKTIKEDYCNLMMTYVADELDGTYTYTAETPQYVEPVNTSANAKTLAGEWVYYEVPFNWIGWNLPTADNANPAGELLNDWYTKEDMNDWATIAEGAADAKFSFTCGEASGKDENGNDIFDKGTCNINGVETTYTVADGKVTFGTEVEFNAGTVDIKGTTFDIVNVAAPGVWLGQQNGEKYETSAVMLFSGFTAGGGWFNSSWAGDWNTNVTLDGDGDYDLEFSGSGTTYGFYIDFMYVLYKYPDFAVTINSITVDGTELTLDQDAIAKTKGVGDSEFTVRYYLVNPWGTSAFDAFDMTSTVKVNVTVSGCSK